MKLCGSWGITILLLLLLCYSLWLVECVDGGDSAEIGQDQDQDRKQLRNKAIETHNGLRALHSAVPLIWDPELEASARGVAENLIKSRRLTSSGISGVGENVAGFKPPQKKSSDSDSEASESESDSESSESELKDDEIAFTSIMDWYVEGENFDWTNPDKNWMNGVAHFSQIVWNSTTSFGMVVVTEPLPTSITEDENNKNTTTRISKSSLAKVIVAHYKPPGNILGQFEVNVFPKIKDSNTKQTTATKENTTIKNADIKESDKINKSQKEL